MLSGQKTYITAAALGILAFLKAMGWIDENTYQALLTLLGALGLAALRAGVAKGGS